ncbi:MAG: thymidine kinase [Acidobacteria bacterium]|nr:MAG: thymidine kinase [Acidobacteriota bacterium]REK05597.1 MAG: thymidine kinase [Acidobacteriota bacterium]
MSADRRGLVEGRIEVITGGMFSGKSEELVRRLRRALIARQRVQVFQPRADTRSATERIVTRDNREISALTVTSSEELRQRLGLGVEVVGIDEAQFFDEGLVDVVMELADLGVRVVVAGLDQDYRRRPFGPMPRLLAVAEYVDKMHAVCVRCGMPAHYSQRIAGGEEQLQVGDVESYEARCRRCYQRFVADPAARVEAADAQSEEVRDGEAGEPSSSDSRHSLSAATRG